MEKIDKLMLSTLEKSLEEKFGYSWDFSSEICTLIESIIEYYGSEYADIIIEAIKDCKVEILQTGKIDVSRIKYNDGMYISIPIIDNGVITRVNRKIILPQSYNMDNQSYRGILISQLLRLIRSFKNEFDLTNGILIQREGITTTQYMLKDDNTLEKISSIGIGYEKGSLDNATLNIMRNHYANNFELQNGNDYERLFAGYIENSLELKDVFDAAALTKSFSELKSKIESADIRLDDFLTKIDKLDELESNRKNSIDDVSQKQSIDRLESYYSHELTEIVSKIENSLKEKNSPKVM